MSALSRHLSRDELSRRLNQQELVAGFGLFALEAGPMQGLLDEACRLAAEGLNTRLAKVLRYRTAMNDLHVVAGVGWHAGVVGHSTLGSGMDSPAGFSLHTGLPTLSNHLMQESRFRTPALLVEHGVQSALNVVIGQPNQAPFGVLEVDSTQRDEFEAADTAFLQGLANVLAAGVGRIAAMEAVDALLEDKDLLIREVHHRVSNSLQLVRTMLALQSRDASEETRAQLEAAGSRIMSIAAVHRHLYQDMSVTEGDAAAYLGKLLEEMRAMVAEGEGRRSIELQADPVVLPAETLTSLGLIVSELVTNAIKHGTGTVTVEVRRDPAGLLIVVSDEGPGFGPEERRSGRPGLGMRLIKSLAKGDPAHAVEIDRTSPRGRVAVTLTL